MPLYEYHCKSCDANVEVLVRNDREKPECPQCHSTKLEKQLSAPAAPSIAGAANSLPIQGGTCGRPQCGSGCMFE